MSLDLATQRRVDYLRSALVLREPDVENDPAFKFEDDDLAFILEMVTPTHNPAYTLETLPDSEFAFVVLLARREVYLRLATATAPFYPLSAEGAQLSKNVRFDHYLALVKQVEEMYANALKNFKEARDAMGEGAHTLDMYIASRSRTRRNLNGIEVPAVLRVGTVTSTTAEVEWEAAGTGMFGDYRVFVDTEPVHDPYAPEPLRVLPFTFRSTDRQRTKFRLTGLEPGTTYYVCLAVRGMSGRTGYDQKTLTTEGVTTP